MKKFTTKSILKILFLTFLIGIAASYYQFTQKPTEIENNITTLSGKITPLYYTNSTLLHNFNKKNIDEYQTAAGTYDLQTIASQITSTLLTAFSSSIEKPLPLIANWNVGIPEYSDGLDPLYMINRLTDGEHLLPTWKLDPYFDNTIGLNYYEASVKKAAELGLPLVFILPSPESALTQDDVYFNMDKTQNPNVITTNGTVLPELSPFAPDSLWKEVGGQWSTTSLMAQLQEWYPNPPLIVFIDEDISKKLSWSKLTTSSRYLLEYPTDTSNEFKRTLVNAKWLEKYRQLHEGFQQGFTKTAWKQNVKFVTRNQLASNMGVTSDWMNSATTTNQYANIWPLTTDGLTINFNLDGDKTDITNAPYTLLNNLPFMLDEAKKINPNFMYQLSIDANKKIDNPQRYRGFTQFALWFLRPSTIRQVPNTTTKDTINLLFQQVVDSVELIYNSTTLTDFWKNGKLITTGNSNYNQNIPINYQSIPREFLLQTDTTMPLWSFALEKGVSPNREWLVYAQSPEENLTNILLNIPNFGNINVDVSIKGSFYIINEINKNIINIQDSLSNISEANTTSATFTKPNSYANVRDYGAVGDGVTDDTSAFVAAFNANVNVYVPNGIYMLEKQLWIPKKSKILFGEGTLASITNYKYLLRWEYEQPINNFIINGLTIKGRVYFNGNSVDGLTIQNCQFQAPDDISASQIDAITLVAQQDKTIKNITFKNNIFIDNTVFPIELLNRWSDGEGDYTADSAIVNVLIENNKFTRHPNFPSTPGNYAVSFSGKANNSIIKNNYVDGFSSAFEISADTQVLDNVIKNCNYMFAGAYKWDNILIDGNYAKVNIRAGWVPSTAIASNIIFTNNTIVGFTKFANTISLKVKDNKFYAPLNTNQGVEIVSCDKVIFQNNYIENNNSSVTTNVFIAGKQPGSIILQDNITYIPNSNYTAFEITNTYPSPDTVSTIDNIDSSRRIDP